MATCWISGTMAGKDLSESDVTSCWYFWRNLTVNGEIRTILTPVMRCFRLALVANFKRVTWFCCRGCKSYLSSKKSRYHTVIHRVFRLYMFGRTHCARAKDADVFNPPMIVISRGVCHSCQFSRRESPAVVHVVCVTLVDFRSRSCLLFSTQVAAPSVACP